MNGKRGDLSKEYKGEQVLAKLIARLVPPDRHYADCMCVLLLTPRHFYVLEDNFNGTYETHFSLSLAQIKSMETVIIPKESAVSTKETEVNSYFLEVVIEVLGGFIYMPKMGGSLLDRTYFMINYDAGNGKKERLYFNDLRSSSKALKKAYIQAKEAWYQ